MANCNSCNGGCGNGTRVGALNSLCRTGCRSPYYTGPCPPAPCADKCGNACTSGCQCRHSAAVIDLNNGCSGSCGCGSCSARNSRGGCDCCNTCGDCAGCNNCNACGNCAHSSGCGSCNACGDCSGHNNCNVCGNCAHSGGCGSCNTCDGCANDWNWECDSCGCTNCGTDCCSNCGCSWHGHHGDAHGVFTCGGPLNLSAGGSVHFESRCAESNDFSVSYGSILIRRPGLYYVHITADIPKNAEVDTVMRLELDGRNVTPPELAITTGYCGGTSNHSCCAVIRACAGSILKLVTLRDLCIETTTAQPVFTVSAMTINPCCSH